MEDEAGMSELVDEHDSKSCEGNLMRVRISLPAHVIYFFHVCVLQQRHLLG